MRRVLLAAGGLLLIFIVASILWPKPADLGRPAFFADRSYDFEANRVLNDVAVAGGDTGEAMQAVSQIKAGDAQGWYHAWNAAGDRARDLASRTNDSISKGNALLRAHTYYRTAEFFLSPRDPIRAAIWKKNVDTFYAGLDTLAVVHERLTVAYGEHHLNAVYYPGPAGAETRPLLVVVGGYDSTMEELYLSVGAAALRHGYAVLTYEGPGQGSVIREQKLAFESAWEKPNGAVLDTFLATHAHPAKIVLLGESLGGYLAPRAAAFDLRIDGVVAFDVFYDGYAVATRNVPQFAFWLRQHGYTGILKFLAGLGTDPGAAWAQENGMWVFGVNDPFAVLDAFRAYRLAPVSPLIKADVLMFAGSDDHFVPADQLDQFRTSLTHARSVTAILFDRPSGGSQHCQIGAPSVWQAALFDWLHSTYAPTPSAAHAQSAPRS
jgi:alpha-beta hydrolase superfamily lysophospholipase